MEIPLQEFEQLRSAFQKYKLVDRKYNINISNSLQLDPPYNKNFPIQIMPRLFNGSRRLEIKLEQVAELKLVYLKRSKDEKTQEIVGKPLLEELIIEIPATWKVEATDGYYDLNTGTVTWRNKNFNLNTPLSFSIDFYQSKVDTNEKDEYSDETKYLKMLKGSYRIIVEDWTASKLHVARDVQVKEQSMVHAPNGISLNTEIDELKWISPIVKHQTVIYGALTWDLRYISAQKVQAIPDVLIDTSAHPIEIGDQEKLLVAPSYHVVNEIIEGLTDRKIFIKQIVESPGYLTETDLGGKQMLYWEIKGRYYRNASLQPVALHLVISGEEPRNNQPNCHGTLVFEISLRSHVRTSESDDIISADLKKDYEEFQKLIRIAAYRGRQIDYKGRRITAWLKEQQFEREMQERLSIKEITVILPHRNLGKVGHLFLSSSECSFDNVRSLQDEWTIHWIDPLPKITISTIAWIDKWQLLNEAEDHENEHTE